MVRSLAALGTNHSGWKCWIIKDHTTPLIILAMGTLVTVGACVVAGITIIGVDCHEWKYIPCWWTNTTIIGVDYGYW